MKKQKILHNRARCLICGDVLESKDARDFHTCSCKNLTVSGGKEYIHRSYKAGRLSFLDMVEFEKENNN